MKPFFQKFGFLLCILFFSACHETANQQDTVLIPRPTNISYQSGTLKLDAAPQLEIKATSEVEESLKQYLLASPIFESSTKQSTATLRLSLSEDSTPASEEGYTLTVNQEGVSISSKGEAGLFYGLQALRQLKELHHNAIPYLKIEDSPRFAYRGLHLDVSRHFFSKEFILKQLEMMSSLKLNRLHFHLTDGPGWRLEVEDYPRLHNEAAWRIGSTYEEWRAMGQRYCSKGDPQAQGGYYTKQDIREIVDFAHRHHIEVIPEIEMPGHSEEVVAVYPELGCRKGASALCLGNPHTYTFLEDVLTEVMELFPSKYIHIGGDEADMRNWATCPKCQAKMQKEGMKEVKELQAHLIHHMEKFLSAHGRTLMGWDEIWFTGLSQSTSAIMSWRGEKGGFEAAQAGHPVVMTPNSHCYLDFYQDAPSTEPRAMSGYIPLARIYAYDPSPKGVAGSENILGVQANTWTEWMPTEEHLEYMIYPRLFALSEIAWSEADGKDYSKFEQRVKDFCHSPLMTGYNYFDLEKATGTRPESRQKEEHKGRGAKVIYNSPWHPHYAVGKALALTDGIHGGWAFTDGWQGFLNQNMEVVVDLGEVKDLQEVSADFLQWASAEIYLPQWVEVSFSEDGKTYRKVGRFSHNLPLFEPRVHYLNYAWQGKDRTRYVKFHAEINDDGIGWLFTDEISIN